MQVADALGLTKLEDLGVTDVHNVQQLALIELTAMFDQYNISYSKRKSQKKKKKDGGK